VLREKALKPVEGMEEGTKGMRELSTYKREIRKRGGVHRRVK